ncbi:hypothetical protein ScPMuIL_004038 [Solemya velum]
MAANDFYDLALFDVQDTASVCSDPGWPWALFPPEATSVLQFELSPLTIMPPGTSVEQQQQRLVGGGTDSASGPKVQSRCTEDVVISGVSCRLPESSNMREFRQNLVSGKDMVTEDARRWEPGFFGLPRKCGKLKDLTRFDASFFNIPPKQASVMDPQLRLLLEVSYEAILDAGVCPSEMKGSSTGVFVAASLSEFHESWSTDPDSVNGYAATGCTRTMFANRLSYFFDFKGPSFAIQNGTSSGLIALEQAVTHIRLGYCSAALVCGSNLCLKPSTTLHYQNMALLSSDGTCKSFDNSADGYGRSEGIVALYLQKSSDARRIYTSVVHVKSSSYKGSAKYSFHPTKAEYESFLSETYIEAEADPQDLFYVEAEGMGLQETDNMEMAAMVNVLCDKREGSLLIGSVKSNIGHTEQVSGLVSILKVIISMEDGMIPANLHFNNPDTNQPAFTEGKLFVVSERTRMDSKTLAGVSSFGVGGAMAHAILKYIPQQTRVEQPSTGATMLFLCSSITQQSVEAMLQEVERVPQDLDLQSLIGRTAEVHTSTNKYRGYCLLNADEQTSDVKQCPSEPGAVWYVFAGMGSQWYGMGRTMMTLGSFRDSILKSDCVLKSHGIDLQKMLLEGDDKTFENTTNSFVGITAIQMALVDTLRMMGVKPDGIVGHSVGELSAAYADGCLTMEETILAAYYRGTCVQGTDLPPGAMAAIGLTWAEATQRCPDTVIPACHNATDSVTVTGPATDVETFVKELKSRGIFARVVPTSGVAFHSSAMDPVAVKLKSLLEKIIRPKQRSSRWISSSIPESQWDSDLARDCSVDYIINNLVSPVLFQEALQKVPNNAIVIEIAPHCLLQAILKRSVGSECCLAGLMKRKHQNNAEFFLASMGKCYINGLNIDLTKLYPTEPVPHPVTKGTPMISPLIKWNHTQQWPVADTGNFLSGGAGTRMESSFEFNISADSKFRFLSDHVINSYVMFPATGYLFLVWKTLARHHSQLFEDLPVRFKNIHIHHGTILPKEGTVKLDVSIMPLTGNFEVCEAGSLVVSGSIAILTREDPVSFYDDYQMKFPFKENRELDLQLKADDIYKEFRLRGYDYGPKFRPIISASNQGDQGELVWEDNWITLMDGMMQMCLLAKPEMALLLPTAVRSISIDPTLHKSKIIPNDQDKNVVIVRMHKYANVVVAGGIELEGLRTTLAPHRQLQTQPCLQAMEFVPHNEDITATASSALTTYVQKCASFSTYGLLKLLESKFEIPNRSLIQKVVGNQTVDVELSEFSKYCKGRDFGLAQVLYKIFMLEPSSGFLETVKHIMDAFKSELLADKILHNQWIIERTGVCFDIVCENILSNHLKVVEVACATGEMLKKFRTLVNSHPQLTMNYFSASNTKISSEDLNGTWGKVSGKSVRWNTLEVPPDNLKSMHLCVAKNVLHKQTSLSAALKNISSLLLDGGFLLVEEVTKNFSLYLSLEVFENEAPDLKDIDMRSCGWFCDEDKWVEIFHNEGFELICKKSGLLSTIFLMRKLADGKNEQLSLDITDTDCLWVDEMKTKLAMCGEGSKGDNLWITANKAESGIIGMINCLRKEESGDKIRCIFNGDCENFKLDLSNGSTVFEDLKRKNLVMNVYKHGAWGSFRFLPLPPNEPKMTSYADVSIAKKGDFSSLKWVESPLKYVSSLGTDGRRLCDVHYASVSSRDVLVANGKISAASDKSFTRDLSTAFGMEFSGKDQSGKNVMGLVPTMALATKVYVEESLLWEVPNNWSLEQAATVTLAYGTAYYSLIVRGRLQRESSVLIHRGTSSVGQAALAIAGDNHCKIFTTVASQTQFAYLRERFPQINPKQILLNKNSFFEFPVMRATKGRGVDIVLNSLSGDKHRASMRVVAPNGVFLDLERADFVENETFPSGFFQRPVAFHSIQMETLNKTELSRIAELLSEGIASGVVKPLDALVCTRHQLKKAFQMVETCEHIGKILVRVRDEDTDCDETHYSTECPDLCGLTREVYSDLCGLTREVYSDLCGLTREVYSDLCGLTREVYSDLCGLTHEVYSDLCWLTREVYSDLCGLTREVHSDLCGLTREVYSDLCGLTREVYSDLCGLTREVHSDLCGLTREVHSDLCGLTS